MLKTVVINLFLFQHNFLLMTTTIATIATQFLQRPELSPATRKSYELTLIPFLQQYGYWDIKTLDRQQVRDYLDSLTHLSYTTHRRHQRILIALMNFAVDEGYIPLNPIARLKPRKPDAQQGEHHEDSTIRYLKPHQLNALYQAIRHLSNWRLMALVRLLHRSGARVSEVLALDLDQINSSDRKFQVIGKGNKRRWCFYSADAAQALERYIQGTRPPQATALFVAQHPKTLQISRLSYSQAYQDWKDAIAIVPTLQDARLHDLRHTFATERVGLMGLEELRALMGHSSIQTTLQYQKVTSEKAELIAQTALDKLLD
jgi:integrase/recombinase XerD